jgi:phage portal protein BeeE
MLGVAGDSQTYANVESRMIEFDRFTLLQWIRRIESTLDAQFPKGTELKVRTAGMMRADTLTRYQAYAVALDNGFLTRDEVRRLEDYPPLDGPTPLPGPDTVEQPPIDDTPLDGELL